ncbi:hypothetical protein LOD99_5894 [Oopsacas minuta]|uniref:Uncharacterized protein n=1 Tax=Oopsacas minuta TaxID=111878 RepID=A0AAV7JNN5_9METZ|nr:hypothetical protein LOD99_5894 [Oopsacas minuta]
MSKYFAKKGKEPKKMGRDPRSDAPPLPGRSPYSGNTLPPKPLNSTKPGYSSEAIEPQLPQRTTNPYPGTWKPPKAPVPLPQEPCLPKSTSTGSFDDEYVAPGELQDGGNDMFGGKQMTSYPTHQPSTPPLSGDEDYAAPDDINHGRTNVTNGYSSNYHAYKQQQVAPSTPPLETSDSEDLYIAPDGEDTYDAPDTDQIISPYHAQRMNYPGPSTPPLKPSDTEDLYMGPDDDREETYDAPDDCIMPAYPTQRMNYQRLVCSEFCWKLHFGVTVNSTRILRTVKLTSVILKYYRMSLYITGVNCTHSVIHLNQLFSTFSPMGPSHRLQSNFSDLVDHHYPHRPQIGYYSIMLDIGN